MRPRPPTVLTVHNRYRERGGEDEVFEAEADLLERNGWRVIRWTAPAADPQSGREKLELARDLFWSVDRRRSLAKLLAAEPVDVVHIHNTFPQISPSVVAACREAEVPVVHTLHNYRLFCAGATLYRNGSPCQDCITRALPWPALVHGCYQDSSLRTGVLVGGTLLHRAIGIWERGVDLFVAPSEFARGRFLAAGLRPERLVVKPNFVDPDPGTRKGSGRYGLYVGRLSESKGVGTLLQAWRGLDIPLKIAGEGPMAGEVEQLAAQEASGRIQYLGRLSRAQVFRVLHGARFLVFPSRSYECCPLTILEAFACGVPVVASGLGAAAELLADGQYGWTFTAGNADELANAAKRAWCDLDSGQRLGAHARRRFEERFSATPGYRELLEVYGRVVRGAEPALVERLAEASVAPG